MPTTDELREVAEIMRDGTRFSVSSCAVAPRLGLECEEFETCAECESMLADCLADLIEPEPERTLSEKDALAVVYEHICGDGYDAECRAKIIIHELAKMCGAKVVE